MKKFLIFAFILTGISIQPLHASDLLPYHIAGAVVGEALGGYSSVTAVMYGQSDWTKAAGIANLALLATQATLGTLTVLGIGEYDDMIVLHKIVGYTVLAASIWLSVSTTMDRGVNQSATPYTSYGYTAVSVVPVIMFSFKF